MSTLAKAVASAAPNAAAIAAALLQQTAHLHIQSILLTAYRGGKSLVNTYLRSDCVSVIDGAEISKRATL